jgi:hypothetical protein
MRASFGTCFLILMAAVALHAGALLCGVAVGGYVAFNQLDQWLARRARNKVWAYIVEDESCDWKPSAEDPGTEEKGDWCRARLSDHDALIVRRITDRLMRFFVE